MIFLGTAAAECYPNPLCVCDSCNNARKSNDPKLKRHQSSLLLNEETIIDFGMDVMSACNQQGVALNKLKSVFVTHSHEDHFCFENINFLTMSTTPLKKVTFYMSEPMYKGYMRVLKAVKSLGIKRLDEEIDRAAPLMKVQTIAPYKEYKIDDMTVFAVEGNHPGYFDDEICLNYVFKTEKQTVLYASDTGKYGEKQLSALKNYKLDIVVIEGTFGKMKLEENAGHMSKYTLCETIDDLIEQGSISEDTRIYITHLAHKGIYNYYDYEFELQQRYGERIFIAYDGLSVV